MDYQRLKAEWFEGERLWRTLSLAFVLPFSLYVMVCVVWGSNFFDGATIRDWRAVLSGTAAKPYVYRQLVPTFTHGIVALTPQGVQETLAETVSESRLFYLMLMKRYQSIPKEFEKENLYPWLVIVMINYLFLLGYAWMLWELGKQLFPQSSAIPPLAPVVGLLMLPPLCTQYAYMYDFPVLFFSAWATLLLVTRQWSIYPLAIALATLNKETSLFLIALYLLFAHQHLTRRQYLTGAALQLAFFAAIKGILTLAYAHNPGQVLDTSWRQHLLYWLDGYSVPSLLGLAVGLFLLTFRWEGKPAILKYWLAMLPILFLSFLYFGYQDEYRVFYEIFPALVLLACHSLTSALGWDRR